MAPDTIFSLVSGLAAVTWMLLVIAPRQRLVVDVIAGGVTPILLGVVYIVLIAANWMSAEGGFGSLADVAALFRSDWLLLAGWIHYLAFDLLVGRWELLDAQKRGLPHLLVVPCLLLTFMFGPGGWLLYLALRATKPAA